MADNEPILIVDDEPDLVDLLDINLQREGFRTLTASTGSEALDKTRREHPALIILDLMLPDLSGTEVCRRIRADDDTRDIPIIMLTAKGEEIDRVVGFEVGADDYVVKSSFSVREMILRVRALLRRARAGAPVEEEVEQRLTHGDVTIDEAAHRVWVDNEEVPLTATEFKLLWVLAKRAGRVQTRGVLLQDVWDMPPDLNTRTVDTHIKRLREKLGPASTHVQTVRGVGYRLVAPRRTDRGGGRTGRPVDLAGGGGDGARRGGLGAGLGTRRGRAAGRHGDRHRPRPRPRAPRPRPVGRGLGRLDEIPQRVRRIAASADLDGRIPEIDDPEAARAAHAVNALLDRLAEERDALDAQARLARSLLEISPSGVLVVGHDERIRFLNPAFRRLVELRGAPEGARPIEVVPVAEVQQAVDHALAGESTGEIAATSGAYDLVVQGVPAEGFGAMVLVQDVTRFRQAERARTDFVANVSHELRTPIASIMGYAETLLEERERIEPDLVRLVQAVYRNGTRLRDLFEDLLTLSRIEARRGELPLTDSALLPILESAVATAADRAAQRNQDFALDCDGVLRAWVNAEALTAIVGNLAVNASNYTPEGGRIRVRAEAAGDEVLVHVQDSGIGIDPAHHQRIFERFYRVDEGRSRSAGGTGLGLAIVKHLALASLCTVTVQSERGKGAVFTVHLPRGGEA